MSEPRYDFCVVVVREKTDIGYMFKGLSVVYNPCIPQHYHERRKWSQDPYALHDVWKVLEDRVYCEQLYRRKPQCPIGGYVMWDIVPILGFDRKVAKKIVKIECLKADVDYNYVVTTDFIREHKLQKWFEELCNAFHKMGGGKYIITSSRHPEVSRFTL